MSRTTGASDAGRVLDDVADIQRELAAIGVAVRAPLRRKFLAEHTHSDDEMRFFVAGSGLFMLHI